MKRHGFLNTVARKYAAGYGIVGIFSILFMLVAVCTNHYISGQYEDAISDLTIDNSVENAVEQLNGDVNTTYNFLLQAGLTSYAADREELLECLARSNARQQEEFVREVTDANRTVETYLGKSDILMDGLQEYFAGDEKTVSNALQEQYKELQEIYSYVTLRFQKAYSAQITALRELETEMETLQTFGLCLQIALLILACLCCVSYLVKEIREISRSIAVMRRGMEAIQKNVREAEPIHMESNDEFDEFADAFNKMTRIIQSQMQQLEENADIREQLAEMEIKNLRMFSELQKNHLDFLQSRVNPHFLFNTLNMISSLARLENADKCAELMETTAAFLRYNLDNISKTVTLEREVENLRDYVAIQKCRYEERYEYFFEIEESCLDFQMPCMILQPLVENTIQHGIGMMLEGGRVWIRVYPQKERICLEVEDNGMGMTQDQIADIYESFRRNDPSSSHIGIRNIYRRLCLFYNDDVVLEFYQAKPGLKIFLSLPQAEG